MELRLFGHVSGNKLSLGTMTFGSWGDKDLVRDIVCTPEYHGWAGQSPIQTTTNEQEQNMSVEPTRAQQLIGDFAPKLVSLTDDVLFGDVWERPGLSKRDRSLITVAALVALYRTDQMAGHMKRAVDNGLTVDELVEAITHLAFYAGWPSAMTAMTTAKKLFDQES